MEEKAKGWRRSRLLGKWDYGSAKRGRDEVGWRRWWELEGGGSWKDEGRRGGIIGTGTDARVGIGHRRRQGQREEGWAAMETNGATWPNVALLAQRLRDG